LRRAARRCPRPRECCEPLIVLLDYGAGNLASVHKALRHCGAEVTVTSDPKGLGDASGAILPGVGAFGEAMARLESAGLVQPLRDYIAQDRPFLGICLGLQLLFESSEESPGVEGVGVFPGRVARLPENPGLKIPHMGWNQLRRRRECWALAGLAEGAYAYFVHSYVVAPADEQLIATTTEHGVEFVSSVTRGRLYACQFHPEKSQQVGLTILRNFVVLCGRS